MQDVIVDPGLGMCSAADFPVSDSIEKMVWSVAIEVGKAIQMKSQLQLSGTRSMPALLCYGYK
jgi:hypothetical protein